MIFLLPEKVLITNPENKVYEKIITHDDFDGLVSAVICAYALDVELVQFAGPRTVSEARISITLNDIVCDLPYPLECGLWFDHHEGNLEDLQYRQIDPTTIPGRFAAKASCARVVYEYFLKKVQCQLILLLWWTKPI